MSYAHEDNDEVYPEMVWLKSNGFNVWYDDGIEAGSEWREEIATSIKHARLVLYFVSPNSSRSKYCRKEINFAVEQNIPIITIHTELTELSDGLNLTLSDLQAIRKYELSEQKYRIKLLEGIATHYENKAVQNQAQAIVASKWKPILRRGREVALASIFVAGVYFVVTLMQEGLLEGGDALTKPVAVLAVLPFTNLDDDTSTLADVFTLEISDRLSKHPDLYVVSSESTFSPLLASMTPIEKRQALQADHFVSGGISKVAQGYLLDVRLENDKQELLWQDDLRFGEDAASQKGLQRRISKLISERLGTKYLSSEYCEPTDNLEAMEAYHLARLKLNQRGPVKLQEAESLLKKSIALDPEYAHAYQALGVAYLLQERFKPEYRGLSMELSRKALDRCPSLGIAYKIWVPRYEGIQNEWIEQEMEWRDSLAMDPNELWLLDNYAQWLVGVGKNHNAETVIRRFYKSNTLQARAVVTYAWLMSSIGDHEHVLRLADKAEELGDKSCNIPMLRLYIARTHLTEDDMIKAYDALPDRCRAMTRFIETVGPRVLFSAKSDMNARKQVLDAAAAIILKVPNEAVHIGIEFSDLDLAFEAIEVGLEQQIYLRTSTWWENDPQARLLRQDPRFAQLVEKLGYVDYWKEFGWPDGMCTPFGSAFVCEK